VAQLEELAAELYVLTPAEFVAARDQVAAVARSGGDPATAAAIIRLRKPTVSAWLLNQLVRTTPATVAGALALGPALHDATRAGDAAALRDLATHRRLLLAELTGRARAIAEDAGQAFTAATQRDIESTFTAAAADETAAAQLLTGRLVTAIETTGFGLDLAPDNPPPAAVRTKTQHHPPSSRSPAPVARKAPARPTAREVAASAAREAEIADAEQALSTARLQAADAAAELAAATTAFAEATTAETGAARALKAAKAQVSDARADLTAAKADARASDRAVTEALALLERVTRGR
jgi:hypothetical protein